LLNFVTELVDCVFNRLVVLLFIFPVITFSNIWLTTFSKKISQYDLWFVLSLSSPFRSLTLDYNGGLY